MNPSLVTREVIAAYMTYCCVEYGQLGIDKMHEFESKIPCDEWAVIFDPPHILMHFSSQNFGTFMKQKNFLGRKRRVTQCSAPFFL